MMTFLSLHVNSINNKGSFFSKFSIKCSTCRQVRTQWARDIVATSFLLGFHRNIERLRIEIEVTSLCDIFFQHHNDVVAIT